MRISFPIVPALLFLLAAGPGMPLVAADRLLLEDDCSVIDPVRWQPTDGVWGNMRAENVSAQGGVFRLEARYLGGDPTRTTSYSSASLRYREDLGPWVRLEMRIKPPIKGDGEAHSSVWFKNEAAWPRGPEEIDAWEMLSREDMISCGIHFPHPVEERAITRKADFNPSDDFMDFLQRVDDHRESTQTFNRGSAVTTWGEYSCAWSPRDVRFVLPGGARRQVRDADRATWPVGTRIRIPDTPETLHMRTGLWKPGDSTTVKPATAGVLPQAMEIDRIRIYSWHEARPAAQFRLDRVRQGDIQDARHQVHGGVFEGAEPTLVPARVAQGMAFGGGNRVRVPAHPRLHPQREGSFAGWARFAVPTMREEVLFGTKDAAAAIQGYEVVRLTDGRIALRLSGAQVLAAPWPADGGWHHVLATIDGPSAVLYIDGVVAATSASATELRSAGGDLVIGADAVGGRALHGELSDVRIYDVIIDAREAAETATYGWFGEAAPFAGRWHLTQGRMSEVGAVMELTPRQPDEFRASFRFASPQGGGGIMSLHWVDRAPLEGDIAQFQPGVAAVRATLRLDLFSDDRALIWQVSGTAPQRWTLPPELRIDRADRLEIALEASHGALQVRIRDLLRDRSWRHAFTVAPSALGGDPVRFAFAGESTANSAQLEIWDWRYAALAEPRQWRIENRATQEAYAVDDDGMLRWGVAQQADASALWRIEELDDGSAWRLVHTGSGGALTLDPAEPSLITRRTVADERSDRWRIEAVDQQNGSTRPWRLVHQATGRISSRRGHTWPAEDRPEVLHAAPDEHYNQLYFTERSTLENWDAQVLIEPVPAAIDDAVPWSKP
jgi:Concanavalin A-like lectin/glucanases superfamily